jgi:hypothetical protein
MSPRAKAATAPFIPFVANPKTSFGGNRSWLFAFVARIQGVRVVANRSTSYKHLSAAFRAKPRGLGVLGNLAVAVRVFVALRELAP